MGSRLNKVGNNLKREDNHRETRNVFPKTRRLMGHEKRKKQKRSKTSLN